MNISPHQISVSGISIEITRKSAVKNLHLGVYPPHGQVRVTAPSHITDEAIRLATIAKLTWIKQQQSKFQSQPRQSKREMVSGESHYFLGDRYLLDVIPHQSKPYITFRDRTHINLYTKPETTTEQRSQLMQEWYRQQLKALIPSLLDTWAAIVGVEIPEWNVKKMKTKWGSCNIKASRIWLNLELAKKPIHCLEYVIVHELIHFHERNHSDRFKALMDKAMPQWNLFRDELNQLPLAYDSWS